MVEAGGVGIFSLLILRDAKNAERGRIAVDWNVSGTRIFILSLYAKKEK